MTTSLRRRYRRSRKRRARIVDEMTTMQTAFLEAVIRRIARNDFGGLVVIPTGTVDAIELGRVVSAILKNTKGEVR